MQRSLAIYTRLITYIVLWLASFILFLAFTPKPGGEYSLGLFMTVSFLVCVPPYVVMFMLIRDHKVTDLLAALITQAKQHKTLVWLGVLGFISIGLVWLVYTGYTHDYKTFYLFHWHSILAGNNPWQTGRGFVPNAFGPTHLLFSPLVMIHNMLPKLLFGACFLASLYIIFKPIVERKPVDAVALAAAMLVLALNPYLWTISLHYASNDIVVGFLCVLSFHLRAQNRLGWAGFCIGVAILYKFYPAFVLPFLAIDKDGIRLKPLVIATVTVLSSFAAAYIVWKTAIFMPFEWTKVWPPKWLSIFRSMQAHPLLTLGIQDIERFSKPLIVIASGIVFLICYIRNIPAHIGASLSLLAALLFHKTGHPQYYTSYILLVGYYLTGWSDARSRRVFWASLPLIAFLTWFVVWYRLLYPTYGQYLNPLRDHIGLVAFPLGLTTLIAALWLASGARREKILVFKW